MTYHKMKKINKYLDISLKMLPVGIAVFFIGSVLFNAAYFFYLNLQWTSLLVLSDYYEGSMEAILYFALIGIIFWGLRSLCETIGKCTRTLHPLSEITQRLLISYLKVIYMKMQLIIICLHSKKLQNAPFSIKKRYARCKKGMPEIQKELIKSAWQIIILSIKILLFSLLGILCTAWFVFLFTYSIYLYNWALLLILILFYLCLKLFNKYNLTDLQSLTFMIVFYWVCMWNIGGLTARPTPGHNLPFLNFISHSQITHVTTSQLQNLILVRAINKGVIAKDNDDIYFIKWEDVKYLHREKAAKKEKPDAKK